MNTEKIPVIYLYKKILFPFCNLSIQSRLKMFKNMKPGDHLLIIPVRNIFDIVFYGNRLATLSEIAEIKPENGVSKVQLKGIERVRVKKISGIFHGQYEPAEKADAGEYERLREELRKKSQELVFLINMGESDKLIHLLKFLVNIQQLTDFIANYFVLKFPSRYDMFNELDVEKRAGALISILDGLIAELKKRK